MVDIESMTIVENLSSCFLNTIIMLAVPSKTSNNEKNTLIARTAITSSVAFLSIYEYQFQMPGIKKCHIPKPIEIMLPIVVRIFIRVFFTSSLCFVGCTLPKVV
jgi:hypothetical protein